MRITVLLMAGIAAVGMMASCASDNGDSPNNGNGKQTVTLSFKTGGTRTLNAPIDGGDKIGTNEGKVSNVALGFFDANGNRTNAEDPTDNTKLITDYDMSGITAGANVSESFTTSSNATTIIAIANVPTGKFTATTSNGYVANYTALLSNTTSGDGKTTVTPAATNNQATTGLPMYGQGTISGNAAAINFERMVARISLNGLSVDLSKSADATATFKPTEIYMYNVNDELTGWGTAPTTSASADVTETAGETNGKCEVTTEKTPGDVTTLDNESTLPNTAYLSSGILSLTGAINASKSTQTDYVTSTNTYSFYVFPHAATNPTKLIIKGVYTPTGGSAAIVYYPITINHYNTNTTLSGSGIGDDGKATNDSQISVNTVYNITVNIQGRGVSSPTQDLSPSTVTVTMGVTKWNSTSQAVTIQ